MQLPNDPAILLSFINTRLRDRDSSLKELCSSLEIHQSELEKKLAAIDYIYDDKCNQFI
ncbi:MAG TPA: DUF4250 domain-containing protein [Ruminococcaceae bacterium]|mgnify:CR=1 FL=1|jgi:DNA-binding transcriptional regulator WhiA|nr:DUF4250 domain-containing protein [Oscillospiraceae bacterium]HCC02213.1 DUF4250 domain-containing protein [Oscillospiraceae bacterium]HCM24529.1 DUF4250 domain-containing protein [Oscillospiraceae bacterium]